jgi:dihydroorotate dehydrogenase electron transfer subunit
MTPQHGRARILENTLLSSDTAHLVLDADWLQQARPGQFIMLRVHTDTDPLLRRPISISAAGPRGIEILFKIRGSGTERMAAWPIGHTVDIIGPLGNGFMPPGPAQQICLVAGGIGVAPLIGLARWLILNRPDCAVHMLIGAGSCADSDAFEPFAPEGCALHISTDDGSRGRQGTVIDMLTADFSLGPDTVLYGCGPMPMLKALAGVARSSGTKCQISLEAHMACGIGACLGCTVSAHTSNGPAQLRVCAEGPVFDAGIIFPGT